MCAFFELKMLGFDFHFCLLCYFFFLKVSSTTILVFACSGVAVLKARGFKRLFFSRNERSFFPMYLYLYFDGKVGSCNVRRFTFTNNFQCEVDEDVEYEFPCYNFTEALDGLWSADDSRYQHGIYGGVLLKASGGAAKNPLLWIMFPRIQSQLRSHFVRKYESESDLYQWFRGSKYCLGTVESLITLEDDDAISVKVRGPARHEKECFFFVEEILGCIDQVLLEMSPGMGVDKHVYSSWDLKHHREPSHTWGPSVMVQSLMSDQGFDSELVNPSSNKKETLQELVCFGSSEVKEIVFYDCCSSFEHHSQLFSMVKVLLPFCGFEIGFEFVLSKCNAFRMMQK